MSNYKNKHEHSFPLGRVWIGPSPFTSFSFSCSSFRWSLTSEENTAGDMSVYSDASNEDLSDELETLGWDRLTFWPLLCVHERFDLQHGRKGLNLKTIMLTHKLWFVLYVAVFYCTFSVFRENFQLILQFDHINFFLLEFSKQINVRTMAINENVSL